MAAILQKRVKLQGVADTFLCKIWIRESSQQWIRAQDPDPQPFFDEINSSDMIKHCIQLYTLPKKTSAAVPLLHRYLGM